MRVGDRVDVGDGFGDGMVGEHLGWCRPDVPSPAARRPLVQLDVAAAVQRAAQRRHERELVGGIVSGAQRQHQVTDLGRGVHDRAVLGPVRDATLAESRLERRQRCAGRQQDGDVAGTAGSEALLIVGLVLDEPPLDEGGDDGVGCRGGFERSQAFRVTAPRVEVVEHLRSEHVDGAMVAVSGTADLERVVRGLDVGLLDDEPGEDVVDPIDHGRRRAEVGAQQCGLGAGLLGGTEILGDVGAPEPVDRLLRITDDEQALRERSQLSPVGVVRRIVGPCREPHGDLELDRVGVLELVEQDPLVARVQPRSDVWSCREQPPREHQEVVELERAVGRPSDGSVEHERSDQRSEQPLAVVLDVPDQLVGCRSEGALGVAERVESL